MTILIFLSVSVAISLNAILQFGVGLRTVLWNRNTLQRSAILPACAMLVSSLLSWLLFSCLLSSFPLGFLEPLLLLPFTALVSFALYRLFRLFPTFPPVSGESSVYSAFDGLALVASWVTLQFATTLQEALFMSIGASLGFYLTDLLLWGIRRRCEVEAIPRFLRGMPLMLISAGLLSLLGAFASQALASLAVTLL